jgi:hypothetical protein
MAAIKPRFAANLESKLTYMHDAKPVALDDKEPQTVKIPFVPMRELFASAQKPWLTK